MLKYFAYKTPGSGGFCNDGCFDEAAIVLGVVALLIAIPILVITGMIGIYISHKNKTDERIYKKILYIGLALAIVPVVIMFLY